MTLPPRFWLCHAIRYAVEEGFSLDAWVEDCYHYASISSVGEAAMPQVLVRDLKPAVIERLKARARRHGRSLQAELKSILEQATMATPDDARALAARIRRRLAGRTHTDSALLIAQDRRR
jgi:plasmid stability protein